jgi:AraC-like DNA-binding protein
MQSNGSFQIESLRVSGPMAADCRLLLAVDVPARPGVQLTVMPHGSYVLTLMLAAGPDPFARSGARGALPHLCGLRRTSHTYAPLGDCRTFYAQLTPEAGLRLAGQALPEGSDPRVALCEVQARAPLVELEGLLASQASAQDQLAVLGAWLQERLQRSSVTPQALRTARLAAGLFEAPVRRIEEAARGEGLSRRQMERDFRQWLNVSPKHVSQVARTQAAMRLGLSGMPLADAAHSLGFADQSHMTNTVKKLARLAPAQLVRHARSDFNKPLCGLPGTGLVYLGRPQEA